VVRVALKVIYRGPQFAAGASAQMLEEVGVVVEYARPADGPSSGGN
jgi:hypothetical protein